MIPLFAKLKIYTHSGKTFHVGVPLFLIWILLFPFLLLAFPFFLLFCLITWINPWRSLRTLWDITCALKGFEMEVEQIQHHISVRIL